MTTGMMSSTVDYVITTFSRVRSGAAVAIEPHARRPSDMSYEELDAIAAEPNASICWSCNQIENVWDYTYLVCLECGHVYHSAYDLQLAYEREFGPEDVPDAEYIYSCLKCAHDF